MIPEGLKYTKDHEWIKIENGEAVVGITDHAQAALGDITFVELPSVGVEVRSADSFAVVESVKAASDVYAPLTGKITAVNEALEDKPELINQSPYDEGWICRLNITDAAEETDLLGAAAYGRFLEGSK